MSEIKEFGRSAASPSLTSPSPADVNATPLSDVFQRAEAIVAKGWTQDAWARDRQGAKVNGASFTAVKWDAGDAIFQAVKQATGSDSFPLVRRAVQAMAAHVGQPIGDWNDAPGRTQAEVVAVFRSLARLPEDGSQSPPASDGEGISEGDMPTEPNPSNHNPQAPGEPA